MKALLCLSAMCLCTALAHAAFAAPLQSTPQETAQPPAPVVRPKPVILKPRPAVPAPGASGSTGGALLIEPIRPRAAVPVSGSTGSTGSTGPVVHRPRTTVAGASGVVAPDRGSGVAGSSGSTGVVTHVPRPKPATAATGSTGSTGPTVRRPAATKPTAPPSTGPLAAAKLQPAGTAAVPFNRTTIVLDPAHGGVDGGSRITDSLQEKDVDLAFAFKLRSLLTARGFNVVLTRDNDTAAPDNAASPLSLDDRAGTANHLHPVACLLLHSTGSGKGVHLYSSELAPLPMEPTTVPWLTAQAPWVDASRALEKQLGTALSRAEIPLVLSRASIRPLDSLACPALVLELAPEGNNKDSVNGGSYQQRVANALAAALIFWQNLAQPPDRQLPAPPPTPVASPSAALPPAGDQP